MNKLLKLLGHDPNSPLTLRSLLDSKYATKIIGPLGVNHQALQLRHDVYLSLHSDVDESLGRLCSVTGTAGNVSRAYKEIISVLFEKRYAPSRAWISLLIPTELYIKLQQIPAHTGEGCIFDDISRRTNARISIEPTPLINTTEHIMKIGVAVSNHYLEELEMAMVLVTKQFEIHRHETLSPNNIYYIPLYNHLSETTDSDNDDINDIDHEQDDNTSSTIQHQQSPTMAATDDSFSINHDTPDLHKEYSSTPNTSLTSSAPSPSLSVLLSTNSDVD